MKNRKAVVMAAIFLVVAIIINSILNFLLVQPGLSRTIFHESAQGGYEAVILGASHGSYGLSTEEISSELGLNTINMCIGGEYMYDSYYVLKYAMKNNDLNTVILDIDYQYLINEQKESILFNNIYNAYPNTIDKPAYYMTKMVWEEYRGTFLKWTNYWQCYYMIGKTIKTKLTEAYQNADASTVSMNPYDTYVGNGFISRSDDFIKSKNTGLEWDESKVADKEIKYIKKIVDLCRENNINIIFTTTCIDTETISEQSDKIAAAGEYIQNLADSYGVTYLNFNALKFEKFERTTADFWDEEGHMYGSTARRFSSVYGEVVRQALDGTLVYDDYFSSSIQDLYGVELTESE